MNLFSTVRQYMSALRDYDLARLTFDKWDVHQEIVKKLEQELIPLLGKYYFPLDDGRILLVRSTEGRLYVAIQHPHPESIDVKRSISKIKGILPIEASIIEQKIRQYEDAEAARVHESRSKWENDASL